ncbi:MAG: YceH family protein [Acidobacteriaceae bacterium]
MEAASEGWIRIVDFLLTDVEARVLGSLIEKEITTPDYYPLSLNALANACNQKSNREPVMSLDEDTLRQALHALSDMGLLQTQHGSENRVPKFEHRMQEVFNFGRREIAVLCILLLRGPQTPGELRGRTERLYSFEELADVQSTLQRLMQREPPLVKVLPRQPGTKEARYMHLLSGEAVVTETPATIAAPATSANEVARIALLEEQVANLQRDLEELRRQFDELLK